MSLHIFFYLFIKAVTFSSKPNDFPNTSDMWQKSVSKHYVVQTLTQPNDYSKFRLKDKLFSSRSVY